MNTVQEFESAISRLSIEVLAASNDLSGTHTYFMRRIQQSIRNVVLDAFIKKKSRPAFFRLKMRRYFENIIFFRLTNQFFQL